MGGGDGVGRRRELAEIVRLALPLMAAQGGYMAMGLVDVAMVGRVGTLDLAAVALGNALFMVLAVLAIGTGMGIEPLVGQAFGAERHDEARGWLWQGTWLVVLLCIPLGVFAALGTFLLDPMGIEAALADRTTDYVLARLPSLPLQATAVVTRGYLSNVARPAPALWAVLAGNLVNFGLDGVLGLGWGGAPALGAVGVGLSTSFAMGIVTAIHVLAVLGERDTSPRLREPGARPSRVHLLRVLRLGWPVGLQLGVEVGVFASVSTLIGRFGDAALAAHQVALTLASFTFMCAVGIGNATTARVGFHIGAGRSAAARAAGGLGLLLGATFMLGVAIVFWFFGVELASSFTADVAVIELGAILLRVAAVFAVADGVQAVAAGALRGAGDTQWSFWANLVAHWVIGLPIGWALASIAAWGVVGYWWGLTVGLVLVAVSLSLRFERLSARPIVALAE